MKVQLSDFCDGCSEEDIASTVQHVLLLNFFLELVMFCKYLTQHNIWLIFLPPLGHSI